jgi:hypothetical protein
MGCLCTTADVAGKGSLWKSSETCKSTEVQHWVVGTVYTVYDSRDCNMDGNIHVHDVGQPEEKRMMQM